MAVQPGPIDKRYAANGVSLTYTVPFLVIEAGDLQVFLNGVLLTSGYTHTGIGNPSSTLTFVIPPAGDLYLLLSVPFQRLVDYQENGDFLSSTVNRDFDRIWQALKQLFGWASRSLRLGTFDVDGAGWYRANGNGIRDLHDPVELQDAATRHSVEVYVASILETGQGPINSAANVVYVFPDGVARTVQDLSNKSNPLLGISGLGYRGRDARIALDYMGMSPTYFGAPGSGLTDALNALNLATAEAISRKVKLSIEGFYAVYDKWVVPAATNGLRITGSGSIRNYSDTIRYVMDVVNITDLNFEGSINIDGNNKTNLIAAARFAGVGGINPNLSTNSLHHVKLNYMNAAAGFQNGDFSAPDNLSAEIKFSGHTYNVPVCCINIGSQAAINISEMDMVASALPDGPFASYTHSIAINHGGAVIVSASEAQMPNNSSGFAFVSCPIDSPSYANKYGDFIIMGNLIETPSIMYLAYNPRGVPGVEPDTGRLIMIGNNGFHNCAVESFQGGVDYSGEITIGANGFFRTSTKTTGNASFTGSARIDISDNAFDHHFVKGLSGINGGIALFDYRQIFKAANLSGATFSSGVTSMVFQSAASSGDNGYFFANYNFTSGVFTVPAGGLKSVRVQVNFLNSQPNNGSALQVRIESDVIASSAANSTYCSGSFELGDLVEGKRIVVQLLNAGSSFAATGGGLDSLVISARR